MAVDTTEVTLDLEPYRKELTGYCYRMLGSGSEADDAVQEAMVRAWRNAATLKAPGALRAWLYRIATNVCLSMLSGAQRRARPLEVGSLVSADRPILDELPRYTWVEPVADASVMPDGGDPETVAVARETVRLAFVAALQHLPPRQRAVLILREVLHFSAAETAELLESTVASVNSALQRARATLEELEIDPVDSAQVASEHEELLDRYVEAFEAYDIDALVALLAKDVIFDMPPHAMWLQGPEDVHKWFFGPGIECRGSRIVRVRANGQPAYAQYRPEAGGGFRAWSIVLVDVAPGGRAIGQVHNFLFPELFATFGLPERLEA
jgi:RNA polymerase sigma-70 factor (ECF subfamily)